MSSAPPGQVSLDELNLEQLNSVKQQLEEVSCPPLRWPLPTADGRGSPLALAGSQELKHLTTAFGDLKTAESKFKACMDALDSLTPANQGEQPTHPPEALARDQVGFWQG